MCSGLDCKRGKDRCQSTHRWTKAGPHDKGSHNTEVPDELNYKEAMVVRFKNIPFMIYCKLERFPNVGTRLLIKVLSRCVKKYNI